MVSSYKIFKAQFRLKALKKVYEEKISKKATRGIDRIGIKGFNSIKTRELKIIYKKCNNGTYRFSPYVEKLKSKGRDKKPRLISVSTIRDRIVLSQLKEILHEIFPECVYRKLPNNYIKEIKLFITKILQLIYAISKLILNHFMTILITIFYLKLFVNV